MSTDKIPFVDLVSPHRLLENELVTVFTAALRSASFVGGELVQNFESQFAEFCNAKHAIAVSSGTDALRFALLAAGVGPDEIVLTVPNTFIATSEAISQTNCEVMFIDIDPKTYSMSSTKLEEFFTGDCEFDTSIKKARLKKTNQIVGAVVPVHLYGQMANMDEINAIAKRYGCVVIEDACQAHGAEYFSKSLDKWVKPGALSRAAAYSFYPGKNLGALGEGGAVTTDDDDIAHYIRTIRDHGQEKKYFHDMEGYNGRLDSIQAGFLSVKLRYLPKWNENRRKRAHFYHYLFDRIPSIALPVEPQWAKSVFHLYVIATPHRDKLQKYLTQKGIGTGLHYPLPLHLQKAYGYLGLKSNDFPVAEKVASQLLSLPMFPELSEQQQEFVVETIADFFETAQ